MPITYYYFLKRFSPYPSKRYYSYNDHICSKRISNVLILQKKTIQAFLTLFPFQHVNSFITHPPFESINIELEDPEATFSFANSHHPDPKRELTRPPFREPRLPNPNRGSNRGGLVTGKKVAPPRILKASLRHIRCIIQEDAAALHCSKVHS